MIIRRRGGGGGGGGGGEEEFWCALKVIPLKILSYLTQLKPFM